MRPEQQIQPDAKSIIHRILDYNDPEILRTHLRELMDCWFLHLDETKLEDRDEVYFSFTLLDDALRDMQLLPGGFDEAFEDMMDE